MKLSSLLVPAILGLQTYAVVEIHCAGNSDAAFLEPEYYGGEWTLNNMANSQPPRSYTSTNQTWISQGYYNFALTVPRGAKSLASEYCACMNGLKAKMQKNMMLCTCKFGNNQQSTLGVGKVPKVKQQQKREYMDPDEAAALWARGKKKAKHAHKGVGPVKVPSCE